MMDDVLSTLTQSITSAQRSLRHRDVTDDPMTLKRPSTEWSGDLQRRTVAMHNVSAGNANTALSY